MSEKITIKNGSLDIPDQPIIPFIEVLEPDGYLAGTRCCRCCSCLSLQPRRPSMEGSLSRGKCF